MKKDGLTKSEWLQKAIEFERLAPTSFDPEYFRKLARLCRRNAKKAPE
jgi:hypothetical protein